ncbi:DNA-directed RNA polymerase subunit II [Gregarina niphandrodes]|uniref:DNA-directed RNA polymerases I, II, and III subunit RPABC5 n=1 Tax=Gregarina niphandrodes TaxID=110365 RepID=A0A023B8Y9_GRENI|nr:DNA-directed RNA polymerase subunit II [Gregarina niphandrodes]EZG70695.1 DNA-directed RNA polymerase subunit II [Gregarina niphandrodes]|eukprot:XP_011129878.1 DNA-directed RNA polymerase subunit II [Gregarina niphandrodes]
MIIPIRCFSCNKPIANKWEPYVALLNEGVSEGEALQRVGCERYCCKRMLLGHVDIIERLLMYNRTASIQHTPHTANRLAEPAPLLSNHSTSHLAEPAHLLPL